jgi:hypothetical protein
VQEKDEKVLEVRPTEENAEINPDREHEKNEAEQENKRTKHTEHEDDDSDEMQTPYHKLDITV